MATLAAVGENCYKWGTLVGFARVLRAICWNNLKSAAESCCMFSRGLLQI